MCIFRIQHDIMKPPPERRIHPYRFTVIFPLLAVMAAMTGCAVDAEEKSPPDIILILADDMGYSDLGCYGSEIPTAHIDQLADQGLLYTRMYSCGRCWPSRATLMTGHYARAVNMDPRKKELGAPGWIKYLPQYLNEGGYYCYHSGKWHINDNDPLAAGYRHSYFNHGWDRHFNPINHNFDRDTLPQPEVEDGYYSTVGITGQMIRLLEEHHQGNPEVPFFGYLAYISPHFPLHALQEDIDLFMETYTIGWDTIRARRFRNLVSAGILDCELSARMPEVLPNYNLSQEKLEELIGPGEARYAVAWEELTEVQQRFQATKMAIHAAMVYRIDQEVGRLINSLKAMGRYDNTVLIFISDNGASAEQMIRGDMHDKNLPPGSAGTYLCIGPGWATAANTPFKRHKSWMNEGGISGPCIISWPEGISARGELRTTMAHFTDILPTVTDLAGVEIPDTLSPELPGKSLVPSFDQDMQIPHPMLYFDHVGNRAITRGEWKLVWAIPDNVWELYDLGADRSEVHDLSDEYPGLVESMAGEWMEYQARLDSLARL